MKVWTLGGAIRKEKKEEKEECPEWKLWRNDIGDLFDDLGDENKKINENTRIYLWMIGGMGSNSSVWGIKGPTGEVQQAFLYMNLNLR